MDPGQKTDLQFEYQNLPWPWSAATQPEIRPFCNSSVNATVVNGLHENFLVSRPLKLYLGEVAMFKISVGCNSKFDWDDTVHLEFSNDEAVTWKNVFYPCTSQFGCVQDQPIIFFSDSNWTKVLVPITETIAGKKVMLRLQQKSSNNYGDKLLAPFALSEFYVGLPCPKHCHGYGDCTSSGCICEPGYTGSSCESKHDNPSEMLETFDESNSPEKYWKVLHGASLGIGCGGLAVGNTLYFDGDNRRESQTVDLNTKNIRGMTVVIRVGDVEGLLDCRAPKGRFDNVLLEYTTNNGLTWNLLSDFDFRIHSREPSSLTVSLPLAARTSSTSFRFRQIPSPGVQLAQWAIDNVFLHDESSLSKGFQDDFGHQQPKTWNTIHNGFIESACLSEDNALIFYANSEAPRIAETMDFNLSSGSFLQFDINLGCSHQVQPFSVHLEFSENRGQEWKSVVQDCVPSESLCPSYQINHEMSSQQFSNWMRVTLHLPPQVRMSIVRFRWIENSLLVTSPLWGLDNVYLGDGCPWMCSGHGYCKENKCICDEGFLQPHCVANKMLAKGMKDTFDQQMMNTTLWMEVYGADVCMRCGVLASGSALVFYKDSLRMAITQDMDLTQARYMQFTLKLGCRDLENATRTISEGVLVQYSNNGGITWHLLQKIQSPTASLSYYFVIDLEEPGIHTNSTRIRFWQPKHRGLGTVEWAIDSLIIRGENSNPLVLYDPVDVAIHPDMWLTWPGGKVDTYCSNDNNQTSLVFYMIEGEHSAYTADAIITDNSIIQFQIQVGCGANSRSIKHPVHLEYSSDHGVSWQLLTAPCVPNSYGPENVHCLCEPSIYYTNPNTNWKKVLITLRDFKICGEVRFRWYQGFFTLYDSPPVWALDELYVGPACPDNCFGHGTCMDGIGCHCDPGYEGNFCEISSPNPSLLKESFEDNRLNLKLWDYWNGAEVSQSCGILVSGNSFHFYRDGERILTTKELDLSESSVLQFHLRLGCSSSKDSPETEPVLVLFSIDFGIAWQLLDFFTFDSIASRQSNLIILELPLIARTNATKLKFWQPTLNGSFGDDWAIDEVYVGQEIYEQEMLQDDFNIPNAANWVFTPGAKIEPTCGRSTNFLHFAGQEENRYAVTTDIFMTEGSFIQFELSMGCVASDTCYDVRFECSHDKGKTWKLSQKPCLPQDSWCSDFREGSIYFSDLYYDVMRVTVPIETNDECSSSSTRFRWIQLSGFYTGQEWALGKVYIGNNCPAMCSGRGSCLSGACNCDDGWHGKACNESKSTLPFEIQDSFLNTTAKHWKKISGCTVSDICGSLASGKALHFYGSCSRILVTVDMDLRNATIVQFYLRYGCINAPTSYKQNVVMQYSLDGGITWNTIRQFEYDEYLTSKYVVVPLPETAKIIGARLRWWQPTHQGRAQDDWALDSIYVGGSFKDSVLFEEVHDGRFLSQFTWLSVDHVWHAHLCSSPKPVAVAQATNNEASLLETRDIAMKDNFILQFELALDCENVNSDPTSSVRLEYSRDYGSHWDFVSKQCIPSSLGCSEAILESSFYSPLKWRRFMYYPNIYLNGFMRFRWQQLPNSETFSLHQWAIRNIYIGPACHSNCHIHGYCTSSGCKCDNGYSGPSCQGDPRKPTYLKDVFQSFSFNESKWQQVYGGIIGSPCIKMENTAAVFSGWGPRLLETVDLDLQDAKFLQFSFLLGGHGNSLDCIATSHRNESVYLQYSIDSGANWHLISEFDYSLDYPRNEYIFLPAKARSISTRFRWWQSFERAMSASLPMPSWALDNVFIGGSLVCPADLHVDFDNLTDIDEKLLFTSSAKVEHGYCQNVKTNFALVLSGGGTQEIRTRELIVGENYMIHFQIVVGCEQKEALCHNFSVHLDYTTKPESSIWNSVRPGCFPSSTNCSPYRYHSETIYTPNDFSKWTRIAFMLPVHTYSSATQFRWIQSEVSEPVPWAVDDIYVGEACPDLCSGHGHCQNGECFCDPGFSGTNCVPNTSLVLVESFNEGFEKGTIDTKLWFTVSGAKIGEDCGSLFPHDHGLHLYFNGCSTRQAVTQLLDLTIFSKLIFILRIGSVEESASCHVNLQSPRVLDKSVLLQYSTNGGISWNTFAVHSAHMFMTPQKLISEIPVEARVKGVQLRWWQPYHDGFEDQWALDSIEVVMEANAYHYRY